MTHAVTFYRAARRLLVVATALFLGIAGAIASPATGPTTVSADTTFDGALFQLLNQDRIQNGVAPLTWNATLGAIAENAQYGGCGFMINGRALDMLQRNYFAHNILNCGSQYVFNILNGYKVPYTTAGENIAWEGGYTDVNQAAAYINTMYMNSPEHRANILNPSFTAVGLGSAQTGPGQTYQGASNVWISTEVFSNTATAPTAAPAAPASAPQTPVLARYIKPGVGHWVTTSTVTGDYVGRNPGTQETVLGSLSSNGGGSMQAIYSCASGAVHFLSASSNCEGQVVLHMDGYASKSSTSGYDLQIFRCRVPGSNDHFVTWSPSCEGQIMESSLGFIARPAGVTRFYASAGHWSATGDAASGYSAEKVLGYLIATGDSTTHGLYSCASGSDHFTSAASNCEGRTVLGFSGYSRNGGGSGLTALYRCWTGTNHFDTTSSNCEGIGRAPEGTLGWVQTTP
jgi:uncharacterized protein YkwD